MKYLTLLLLLVGCKTWFTKDKTYVPDTAFIPSGLANSLEYPVIVKDRICADVEGIPGLCSVRVKSNDDLTIKFLPQQYGYRLLLQCSRSLGIDTTKDVPKNTPFQILLSHSDYNMLKSFICIGEILPADRGEVSSKFEIRVKVYSEEYSKREDIHMIQRGDDYYLHFGTHALYTSVFQNGEWSHYEEKIEIHLTSPEHVIAFSESQNGRFNFYRGE